MEQVTILACIMNMISDVDCTSATFCYISNAYSEMCSRESFPITLWRLNICDLSTCFPW